MDKQQALWTHTCEACGGRVRFLNRKPHDLDGKLHWDTCKERQFDTVKKHGTPYCKENEAGYIYKGERWRTWLRGPRITGSQYSPNTCDCGLPPWELCKEDCTARI